jgi:hypothetical protein
VSSIDPDGRITYSTSFLAEEFWNTPTSLDFHNRKPNYGLSIVYPGVRIVYYIKLMVFNYRISMKILKILLIINLFLLLMQGFAYVNLLVSEKHETQLEGWPNLTDELKLKSKERYEEIQLQKKNTFSYSKVLASTLIILLIVIGIIGWKFAYS